MKLQVLRTFEALALIFAMFLFSGCRTQPPIVLGGAPDDLALDLTVLPAPGVRNEVIGSLILPAEAARYVVQADGTLQVIAGPAAQQGEAPQRVRRLSTGEMFDVWQRLQPLLRFDQAAYQGMNLPELRKPPQSGVAYIIWMRAHQQEQLGRVDSSEARSGEEDGLRNTIELIRLLDRLSWRS